jgi:hypothetical protein
LASIGLWTLGPPFWFLKESAARITRPHRYPNNGALTPQEQFFFDSAGKFWAGVLALLTAVYAKDKLAEAPKGPPAQPPVASADPKMAH